MNSTVNREITVNNLLARENPVPQTLLTLQNPLKITNWTLIDDVEPVTDEDFIEVPIFGDIPYGDLGQVKQEDIVGYQHVYRDKIGRGQFFLRTRGDAMAPLILDGDLLLIEPGPQWKHKTIVAIYIDRHVTCKQLHLYDHGAALVSANLNYAPIIVTEDMVIIGWVIKIERNLVEGWQPLD